jgi:hypothetical protein
MRLGDRRRAALFLSALLLAGAATACGSGDKDKPDASGGQASSTEPTVATVAPDAAQPAVVLEEAGSQPRQVLLLKVAPGSAAKAALVSKVGIQLTVDGQALPSTVVPATSTVLSTQVDKVDPDGTAHYTVVISDVGVLDTPGADPAVVSQTQTLLAQLKGLKGTGTVDAHGGNQTSSFDTRNVTNPVLKSTLDSVASQVGNLTAPLPAEAVGVGARWTANRAATINGITMRTATRYTLRSRTGDRYELDVVQDATAPPGTASIPNLPAGVTATITSFTIHTSGRVAGDLTKTLPSTSSVSGAGDGVFTVSQGTNRGSAKEHLTIEVTLSPA